MLGGELSTFGPFSDIHLGLTQVIIITRLHAMYQSRKMFIFLIVFFVAITIAFAVMGAIENSHISGGKC